MVICLERGADLHMAQLMPLPLTVSCFSEIQIGFTFVVPAHLGSPGKRAVKRVCVCVCVCLYCMLVQLVPLPFTISCCIKSRLVLTIWYRLTQVVPEKGPLNGCMCVYYMLLHLSFFLHFFLTYLLPYLSFPLRIDPLHFQAGCCKRQLNL